MNQLEEAKSIIEEVLQRREFQRGQNPNYDFLKDIAEFLDKVITNIRNFIYDLLEKIFGWIKIEPAGGSHQGSDIITFIVRFLLLLATIALIIFIVVKLRKIKGWKKKLKTLTDEEIEEFINNEDLPYSLAEKYKAEGNYRMALRYLFISLLVQLNKREIIRIQKAKTNRQYYREIKKSCPAIAGDFGSFANAFAFHWYGIKPVDPAGLEAWYSVYHGMLERGVKADEEK